METSRSPMDNLFNMLSSFSAGHDKALKQGLYNAVALFLLCLVLAAGYGLYVVLSPFVKPLIWALLCGSVLFPFKYYLATIMQSWFIKNEVSHKPLIMNLILLPIQIIDESSKILGSFFWKRIKYITTLALTGSFSICAYYYMPNVLACLTWRAFTSFSIVLTFFISSCSLLMIAAITVGYFSVLYIYWSPCNTIHFRYTSFVLWFIITLYLSNIMGSYQIIIFIILQLLYLTGFIYEILLIMESEELEGRHITFMSAVYLALTNYSSSELLKNKVSLSEDENYKKVFRTDLHRISESLDNTVECTVEDTIKTATSLSKQDISPIKFDKKSISQNVDVDSNYSNTSKCKQRFVCTADIVINALRNRNLLRRLKSELRASVDIEDDKIDANKYMYGTLYACIGMLVWKHKWIIHILTVPVAYYIMKQMGCSFGLWKMMNTQCQSIIYSISSWCVERHEALLPANVRGLYKIGIIIDKKMTQALKGSVDAVATAAVILGLLIFSTCASIFITIQIYAEGMHLIQTTGEILNSSLMNNPDIDWVPEQWEESVNNVLDNAYTYGRSAISDGIRGLVKDLEPSKVDQMEKKVLELWDRLYQAWMMSSNNPDMIGPTVNAIAAYSAWESFKDSYGKIPFQLFNMTNMQNFLKENIGILMSVLDSIWTIVMGNVSVILTVFTELLYVILMSGSAVLSFTLSMIVFFTALFYLLNSSDTSYKPIELATIFSPISCHRFVVALQEAVIGVFVATFKLASFFGMWTWLIHNMFQVKIVYLPSTLAAILGAVPVLDAYFASIPATLELWFTQGPVIAVFFFMFHFLPCNIVITEFYKEMKGAGHPYLTGLSIAGGVFCLGVQGAIFGPLLLCCIMVAINLGRSYFDSPSEEDINAYSRLTR